MPLHNQSCSASSVLIVIPVYNHSQTLRSVAERVLCEHHNLLVVDDGSTDLPPLINNQFSKEHPLYGLNLNFIRHDSNKGKGAAILTAVKYAKTIGASHIITIDADAQHDPSDIPLFLEAINKQPQTIFIGARNFNVQNIPFSSRFGRAFSNFWFKVQTSHKTQDSQSGFRAYPLIIFDYISFMETRYSFETEVLVKSVWAGFSVADIPISVYYPSKTERISHFKAFQDNLRISLLNTYLTFRSILPWPHKQYAVKENGVVTLLRPMQSLKLLLQRDETPLKLAYSAAVGMGIGTLAIFGLHSILIILITGGLRLSKIMGLSISQLCMPPIVPLLCIELGYFLRYGAFLTNVSWAELEVNLLDRVYEWILGSLVLAPVLAVIMGLVVWIISKHIQNNLIEKAKEPTIENNDCVQSEIKPYE
ncbi:DUF2062 domain-containing protein [Desulfovibrio litoralis]|uniref:Glycosyltransferase involved in cell wall bisynthesis n=1 Tax=Desulfovibrio litoralis DSM 11393 TaxID=1121455 RepID=A0A1M7STL2_9BACT|nr:DUF2062 domain-containing protein [Desulfovibrio litoralis]SHN61887.1 Glycosyltransferase involved in cell wall bisynthesis [Desulfovibrio litoralis DSM 11393]